MKKIKYIVALTAIGTLFFTACKKDNDTGPQLNPNEKILTSKIWSLKSLTIPKAGAPTQDSSILKSCADSAKVAFSIYKQYQVADGSKKGCDSVAVPYDKGTWALSASGDSLTLTGTKRNLKWKIVSLNATGIKAIYKDSTAPDKVWMKTILLQ